jgi:hypothetical protein
MAEWLHDNPDVAESLNKWIGDTVTDVLVSDEGILFCRREGA